MSMLSELYFLTFIKHMENKMIQAQKEIIWHLTCMKCKGHWSYATMEEKYCIDRGMIYCPHCGQKEDVVIK